MDPIRSINEQQSRSPSASYQHLSASYSNSYSDEEMIEFWMYLRPLDHHYRRLLRHRQRPLLWRLYLKLVQVPRRWENLVCGHLLCIELLANKHDMLSSRREYPPYEE